MTAKRRENILEKLKKALKFGRSWLNSGADIWLDPVWYAQQHALDGPREARRHYKKVGIYRNFAPRAEFARTGGLQNRQWACELMFRRGAGLGCSSIGEKPSSCIDLTEPSTFANASNKRVAVVSAIFGPYDKVLPLDPAWTDNADFFLFTDQVFPHLDVWNSVNCSYVDSDLRRMARYVKTSLPLYFDQYEWVMWIDGNVLLCADPQRIVDLYVESELDFVSFEHPLRSNVIAEAAACHFWEKEGTVELAKDLARKFSAYEFADEIMFETCVCLTRPRNSDVKALYELWWSLISEGSKRDQLSLPIAVHGTPGLRYTFFPKPVRDSPWFAQSEHRG